MSTPCTLIVAAYPTVRAGLAALLRETEGVCVQGEVADSGELLRRLLPGLTPDAVLYDTTGGDTLLPVLDALTRGSSLEALATVPALVVLGDSPERDIPRLQSTEGLRGWGYLPRDTESEALVAAIRAAAAGLVVTRPTVGPTRSAVSTTSGFDEHLLTHREREVLQLMALGLPNKTIAHRLGITLHTAKFHVAQILAKLGAASRTEAVTLGARQGFVAL